MNEEKIKALVKAIAEEADDTFCHDVCPIGPAKCKHFRHLTCGQVFRDWLNDKLPEYCEECSRDDFLLEYSTVDEDGDKIVRVLRGICRKCGRRYYIKEYFVFDHVEEDA